MENFKMDVICNGEIDNPPTYKRIKYPEQKDEILICDCESAEHQIVFRYDDGWVYLSIHLSNYRGFWKRLLYGVKYIFGHQSRFGAFDEVIITENNYNPIKKTVKYLEFNPKTD